MLPEPTIPKRRAASPAPQPWVMTPLFCVPDSDETDIPPPPRRRAARPAGRERNTRRPAVRARRDDAAGESGPGQQPTDLLTVPAQRLRQALARSFLRYGIPGDLEAAVHAAMNVIEPVLQARDAEILRLRRLMGAKMPGR